MSLGTTGRDVAYTPRILGHTHPVHPPPTPSTGRRRSLLAASLATATLLITSVTLAGCQPVNKRDGAQRESQTGPVTIAGGRMTLAPKPVLGPQQGFLRGGLVYAAVDPGKFQLWLQQLPLEDGIVRDLNEAGQVLGVDMRTGDVLGYMGIDTSQTISMTLMRPSNAQTLQLRKALGPQFSASANVDASATALQELRKTEEAALAAEKAAIEAELQAKMEAERAAAAAAAAAEAAAEAARKAEVALVADSTEPKIREVVDEGDSTPPSLPTADAVLEPPPTPTYAIPPEPPPPPPPIPEKKERHAQTDLAATLNIHSRVHARLRDRNAFTAALAKIPFPKPEPTTEAVCDRLAPHLLCAGDEDALVVIRDAEAGAVALDLFMFPARVNDDVIPVDARVNAIQLGLNASAEPIPMLADMAGDAAIHLDTAELENLAELTSLADAFHSFEWEDSIRWPARLRDEAEKLDKLRAIRSMPRLFKGVRAEAMLLEHEVQSTTRWVPTDEEARLRAVSLFTRAPHPADMPPIDGLCERAMACGRARGMPKLREFGALATGPLAGPIDELDDVFNDAHELVYLSLFAETWPNLLGLMPQLPATVPDKMAGGIITGMLDLFENIEGFAYGVYDVHYRKESERVERVDFVSLARAPSGSASVVRGLLGFASIGFQPVENAGTDAIERAELPGDLPFGLFVVRDAEPLTIKDDAGAREVPFGWVAMASDEERLKTALALPRENPITPALYTEIPDLWAIFNTSREMRRELEFANTWLSGRSVKMAVDVIDGWPHVDMIVGKTTTGTSTQAPPPPPPPEPPPPEPRPPEPEPEPPIGPEKFPPPAT